MLFLALTIWPMVRLNSRKRKAIKMAKIVFYRDDFDGTEDSTVVPRRVLLEEGTLTIDLSKDNYGLLVDALKPFMDAGEWTERETGNDENTVIRDWARKHGHDVSARGRLAQSVVDAYREHLKSLQATAEPAENTDSDSESDNVESNDSDNSADNGSRELTGTAVA